MRVGLLLEVNTSLGGGAAVIFFIGVVRYDEGCYGTCNV